MNLEKINEAIVRAEAERFGMRIGNLCDIPTEQELLDEVAAIQERRCGWCNFPLGIADYYGFCPECVSKMRQIVTENRWDRAQARLFIMTLKQNPLAV